MLFMIIERFKNRNPIPVYLRFREKGRMAPSEVKYISSWITTDLTTCYQIMDAPSVQLIQNWIDNWKDIVDFEVIEVITSAEAASKILPS